MKNQKLFATDLDGTFLCDDKSITPENLRFLDELGTQNIVRVAATGRSLFKVKEVLSSETPFDFIVFSSGAGIANWKNDEILISEHFEPEVIENIVTFLLNQDLNFFLFQPIPNNNLFWSRYGKVKSSEFENYLSHHQGDYEILDERNLPSNVGQVLVILPYHVDLFESIKSDLHSACSGIKVIRTTSPINGDFIWLEIFPETVSKGHGIKWICDQLKIDYQNTMGIGNDFNDLDMLNFVHLPLVVANGADELKQMFCATNETNNESAVAKVFNYLI